MDNVFILKNDKELHKVGTINSETKEGRIILTSISSVNYFNKQVFDFIIKQLAIKAEIII